MLKKNFFFDAVIYLVLTVLDHDTIYLFIYS